MNQITISKILDDHSLGKRALKINGKNSRRNQILQPFSPLNRNYLAPSNQSMIMSFPSPVEYQEWCEKFCYLLSTKFPQIPHTPQQVSKVDRKKFFF